METWFTSKPDDHICTPPSSLVYHGSLDGTMGIESHAGRRGGLSASGSHQEATHAKQHEQHNDIP